MPKLILHYGTPKARTFELKPGANFLGRDSGNDVTIDDISVSGSHAQIEVNEASATITDLGSSNGTFIDREPVVEAVLHSGQFLRIGGVEMYFAGDDTSEIAEHHVEVAPESITSAPATVRLRVPTPAPVVTSAPLGAPPLAPRISSVASTARDPTLCKFHPRAPSRWQCPQCGQCYCDLCVTSRRVAEGQGYFCRPCGVQCSPIAAPVGAFAKDEEGNFYTHLPGTFLYPFKSGVGFVLVCTAIFFAVAEWFASHACFGIAILVCILGYTFVYMQKIVQCTVQGEDREPPMPDVTNFAEDLMLPAFQFVATLAFCYWPAIGLLCWSLAGGPYWAFWAMFPALALGCLYFPMAFLCMATFDTLGAVSPTVVVPAIMKIPLQYLVACACLVLVLVARWAGAYFLSKIIPIPIVPDLISEIIGLYFLAVQCRMLGLLYYTNRHLLAWMRH